MNIDLNALLTCDISGIDIQLPEELGQRIMQNVRNQVLLNAETAMYLYGPNPTAEQAEETATIVALYVRKRLEELDVESFAEFTSPE